MPDETEIDVASVELLSMRELAQVSGVPRSTIQFYTREEVLPPPQRLSNNRLVYGRIHGDLLEQIRRLKDEGLSIAEIRQKLKKAGRSSFFYKVDAAEAFDAATRAKILEAAADQFGTKGYKRARLSDVIKQAGVTPQVFGSHFASKKQLFAESFGIASQRVMNRAIPAMELEPDVRRKLLARFGKLLRSRLPDPSLWALARTEALYEGGEPAAKAQQIYERMSSLHAAELARLREQRNGTWPEVSDELMAYCFLGAEEYLIMRLGWDDRFSREDALRAYLLLIAAVHAQYDGDLDVKDCWETMRATLG